MTGLSMPACTVSLLDGHAYPIRSDIGWEGTLLSQVPLLPAGFHWAIGPEVRDEYVALDIPAIARLLYGSGLDPMAVGDHAVIAACHDQLSMSHGNTTRAQAVYAHDVLRDQEVTEARMRACTVRAALLLNTEAA